MNSTFSKLLRAALYVSPPFLLAIGALALSSIDWVTLDPRITWRSVLALNVVCYWAFAAIVLALLRDRGAVRAFCSRYRVQIVMAAISLSVSAGMAEVLARTVVARTQGWRLEPSPTLHHINPPGISVRDATGSMVTINDDGFRTTWTQESFHGQRERIAFIGDSFTFGLGVNNDENAPYFLERILRERLGHDDVGVLNAGVISWSPLIERNAFREIVSDYRPTLTILMLDLTDIADDIRYAEDILPGSVPAYPTFVTEGTVQAQTFALIALAEPILRYFRAPFEVARRFRTTSSRSAASHRFEVEIGDNVETNRWFVMLHPLELTRPYFETTLSYVRDIARDVEAAGSKFVVVVAPRYWHWSDRECPEDWNLDQRGLEEPFEYAYTDFFAEAAANESFPIFSLLPAFQATDRFPLVLHNDAHWNPAGNRFVAETLAEYLIDRNLVR